MSRRLLIFFTVFLLAPVSSAWATGIVAPVVEDNSVTAGIDLGVHEAELTIRFEEVVGLSVENLGLSAELVDPTDPSLLARLGDSVNIAPVGAFPVLVRIQPPASGGLSFSGIASIEIYTHDLQYTAGTPLRLFSAPDNGDFREITADMSSGSYRVRGSKGTFSEFLIVADLRLTESVVDTKFNALSGLLYGYSTQIGSGTFSTLENKLTQAEAAWNSGDVSGAISAVEAFSATVKSEQGMSIPAVWRSSRDLDNVAGELRARADTLRFSLTLASNSL